MSNVSPSSLPTLLGAAAGALAQHWTLLIRVSDAATAPASRPVASAMLTRPLIVAPPPEIAVQAAAPATTPGPRPRATGAATTGSKTERIHHHHRPRPRPEPA